jgi:hypothetical protein
MVHDALPLNSVPTGAMGIVAEHARELVSVDGRHHHVDDHRIDSLLIDASGGTDQGLQFERLVPQRDIRADQSQCPLAWEPRVQGRRAVAFL